MTTLKDELKIHKRVLAELESQEDNISSTINELDDELAEVEERITHYREEIERIERYLKEIKS